MSTIDVSLDPADERRALSAISSHGSSSSLRDSGAVQTPTPRRAPSLLPSPVTIGELGNGIHPGRGQASIGQVQRVNSFDATQRSPDGLDQPATREAVAADLGSTTNVLHWDTEDDKAAESQRSGDSIDSSREDVLEDSSARTFEPRAFPHHPRSAAHESTASRRSEFGHHSGELITHKGSRSAYIMSDSPSVRPPTTAESLLPDFADDSANDSIQHDITIASDADSDFSAIETSEGIPTKARAGSTTSLRRPPLGWSSDETFSPIASRTTSFAAPSGPSHFVVPRELHNVSRSLAWDTLDIAETQKRSMSAGSPTVERSPSPVRAASVEVLSASYPFPGNESDASSSSSFGGNVPLSPAENERQISTEQVDSQHLEELSTVPIAQRDPGTGPKKDHSTWNDLEHSIRSVESSALRGSKRMSQTKGDHPQLSGVAAPGLLETTFAQAPVQYQGNGDLYTRPTTGETASSVMSNDYPTAENDAVLDISYEQSFVPPGSTIRIASSTHDKFLMPVDEGEELQQLKGAQNSDSPEAEKLADCRPPAPTSDSGQDAALRTLADTLGSEELLALDEEARELQIKEVLDLTQVSQGPSFDTPRSGDTYSKPWETPAATKQYMRDAPTRTAISRKVENFQIPPERLSAMQPEIAAMQKMARKPSDKLSLKESSAQIDALLNENWGLKMKIMFMDQHFEHDREKAELIAENVRLQTNGFNFVQQVKSRDKLIKSLEKQVADLEYRNALEKASNTTKESSVGLDQDRICKLEHYIDQIEAQHDERLETVQNALHAASQDLLEAEKKLSIAEGMAGMVAGASETDVQEILVRENQELRQTLADAELELDQQAQEYSSRYQYLKDALATRDEDMSALRHKLTETSETLRNYELELDESDQMRQDAVDEIKNIYEAERLEYEMYIEDRHEEIDNLKQALNCYNQDSFEARLAEAVRPHEDAWREINRQCLELQEELSTREEQWLQTRNSLESRLLDASSRENALLTDLESLQAQLQEKEDLLKTLHDERIQLEKQLHDNREASEAAARAGGPATIVTQLESRIDILNAENAALRGQIDELDSQWQTTRKANDSLSIDLQTRIITMEQSRQDIEDRTREIASLRSDAEEQQNQMDELDRRCQQYQDDVAALHAEIDEIHHLHENQDKDVRLQHESDQSSMMESFRTLEAELKTCQSDLRIALQDASKVTKELRDVESHLAERSGGQQLEVTDVAQRLSALLQTFETEKEELQTALMIAKNSKDEIAFDVRKNQTVVDQMEANLRTTQKRCSDAEKLRLRAETQLRSQTKEADELRRALSESHHEATRARHSMADALDHSNALLSNVLVKINSLLSSDQQRGDLPSVLEFGQFQSALQSSVDQLWQQIQHTAGGQKAVDSELRKKIADLEAQISNKTQRQERLKAKLDEANADNELLRRQKISHTAEERKISTSYGRSAQKEVAREPNLQRALEVPATTLQTTSESNAGAARDDHWALHERIKALNKDLKYQKELREQDDIAAKVRLSESKKENEDLRKMLDSKDAGPRVLTLGRKNSGSRAGSRASHRRIEGGLSDTVE